MNKNINLRQIVTTWSKTHLQGNNIVFSELSAELEISLSFSVAEEKNERDLVSRVLYHISEIKL